MMADDLVKRARAYANDPMWADHCEVPKAFMFKMVEEIERLEDKLKTIGRLGLPKFYSKELLDDMRAHLNPDFHNGAHNVKAFIDAYEKDRNKTEYEHTFGNPPPPRLKGY